MVSFVVANSDKAVDSISSSLFLILVVGYGLWNIYQSRLKILDIMGLCGRKLELIEKHIWGGKNLLYIDTSLFVSTLTSILMLGGIVWWHDVFLGVPLGESIVWRLSSILFLFTFGFLVTHFYTEKRLTIIKDILNEEKEGEDNE